MTITKALDRFKWRLQNGWKPNENDIEAYNTIVDFVEKKHEQQFNDNQLFGKLYIALYGELLRYHDCTVFNNQPTKDISTILNAPIELLIEKFLIKANDQEKWQKMKDFGMTLKHPLLMSQSEKKADLEKFDLEMLDPVMTFDEAKENLTKLINLALNEFS